jgi:hypothetical protein
MPCSESKTRSVKHTESSRKASYLAANNTKSGKEVALLPLPPLRTGRESFPSSGSSRCEALREQSRSAQEFLRSLDDMYLQSVDRTHTFEPVELVRVCCPAGGCTHGLRHVHLLFPPAQVLPIFSSRTTRWKSARLHGGVMLQPLSAPLQNGLRFFQHPLPAIPSAFLADAPAPQPGRNVGFTMLSSSDTNELAPAFHAGSLECPCVPCLQ